MQFKTLNYKIGIYNYKNTYISIQLLAIIRKLNKYYTGILILIVVIATV